MAKPKKFIYNIILTSNGKEVDCLCRAAKESTIYAKFNALIKENKEKIVFPIRYINIHGLIDANYELVIIKSKDEKDVSETKLRDEYGKYVSYVSSSEDWVVVDRAHYEKEEAFWVYGFHPHVDRKNFKWIFNNYIKKNCNKDSFKNILVYKNKLIIDVNGHLDIVFCKNRNDCVRLFNKLEEEANKAKLKYILWGGEVTNYHAKKELVNRLIDWTGWDSMKIRRSSLRP